MSDSWRYPAGGVVENVEKTWKNGVACFHRKVQNAQREPLKVQRENRMTQLALYVWRLSLGDLQVLAQAMFARDTSRGAGSEARGEGRERDYFD